MQAIILAAGMGRRLGELTNNNTKCMLEVNGVRLIDRTLETIAKQGIKHVVLVVGYEAQNVKDWVGTHYKGMDITYVENSVYDKTNNIYSIFHDREYLLKEDKLILESDHIFKKSEIKKIGE